MGVSTGIRVDLTALTRVLTDLRRDIDQGMAPSTQGASGELGDTARFGDASASGEVLAGATDVSYAAAIAAHNVKVHIDNAYAIASLIEGAVAGYRSADALAGSAFASLSTSGLGGPAAEAALPASGASGAGLTPVFVGPLPAPKIPRQELTQAPHALNWESYDTPRMWSMVSREVSDEAWQQMHAFRRLSDALDEQHRRMLALRERLVAAWSPQGAGAEVLAAWDKHTSDLKSDAMCAYMTAHGLGNILQALSDARADLSKLNETWRRVTSDYMPEWWDHKAELTNAQARVVMLEAEKAIADHRRGIAVPDQATSVIVSDSQPLQAPPPTRTPPAAKSHEESRADEASAAGRDKDSRFSRPPVPPMPRHGPTLDGPGLAGSPSPVPLSPMSPPSLLPIPPGVFGGVPNGGAYVLPGPWSRAGAILPMPEGTVPTAGYRAGGMNGPKSSGSFGVPMGFPGSTSPARESNGRSGMASTQWEVATGVDPVIGEAGPFICEHEEVDENERARIFQEWFGPIAMPWEMRSTSSDLGEGTK